MGNLKDVFAGIEVFDGSRLDDGLMELGVVTAKSRTQWAAIGRVVLGRAESSPFVVTTRGITMRVDFDRLPAHELPGGVGKALKYLRIKVCPASITVCVTAAISPGLDITQECSVTPPDPVRDPRLLRGARRRERPRAGRRTTGPGEGPPPRVGPTAGAP